MGASKSKETQIVLPQPFHVASIDIMVTIIIKLGSFANWPCICKAFKEFYDAYYRKIVFNFDPDLVIIPEDRILEWVRFVELTILREFEISFRRIEMPEKTEQNLFASTTSIELYYPYRIAGKSHSSDLRLIGFSDFIHEEPDCSEVHSLILLPKIKFQQIPSLQRLFSINYIRFPAVRRLGLCQVHIDEDFVQFTNTMTFDLIFMSDCRFDLLEHSPFAKYPSTPLGEAASRFPVALNFFAKAVHIECHTSSTHDGHLVFDSELEKLIIRYRGSVHAGPRSSFLLNLTRCSSLTTFEVTSFLDISGLVEIALPEKGSCMKTLTLNCAPETVGFIQGPLEEWLKPIERFHLPFPGFVPHSGKIDPVKFKEFWTNITHGKSEYFANTEEEWRRFQSLKDIKLNRNNSSKF